MPQRRAAEAAVLQSSVTPSGTKRADASNRSAPPSVPHNSAASTSRLTRSSPAAWHNSAMRPIYPARHDAPPATPRTEMSADAGGTFPATTKRSALLSAAGTRAKMRPAYALK